jgi:hypothetical protein
LNWFDTGKKRNHEMESWKTKQKRGFITILPTGRPQPHSCTSTSDERGLLTNISMNYSRHLAVNKKYMKKLKTKCEEKSKG